MVRVHRERRQVRDRPLHVVLSHDRDAHHHVPDDLIADNRHQRPRRHVRAGLADGVHQRRLGGRPERRRDHAPDGVVILQILGTDHHRRRLHPHSLLAPPLGAMWSTTPMETLPVDADDLTPEWLSDALGADVVGVEVLDHAFATNQRMRIGLTYGTPGAGPASLFVKLAPLDPAHREMIGASGMGEREAQFYSDVAPSVDLRVPRSYWAAAATTEPSRSCSKTSAPRAARFSDGSWGIPADAAAGALEDLARFHGRFADPAVRSALAPWLSVPRVRRTRPHRPATPRRPRRARRQAHSRVRGRRRALRRAPRPRRRVVERRTRRPTSTATRTSATSSSTATASASSTGACLE